MNQIWRTPMPLDVVDVLERLAPGARPSATAKVMMDAATEIRSLRMALEAKQATLADGDVIVLRYDGKTMSDGDLWHAMQYLRKQFPEQQVVALPDAFDLKVMTNARQSNA